MNKKKHKVKYNQLRIELAALATGMFYNAQEERIKAFNRIRQIIFRKLEGLDLTEKQDKKPEEDKYKEKYTDKKLIKYIEENKVKLDKEEQDYVDKLMNLLHDTVARENEHKALMAYYIDQEPIFTDWLVNVKGISTLNTANLLQYFGYCEKAKHCSSLWKYAGLHVVQGKAPKLSMYGKDKEIKKLDFNPKLRTLMYRIGDCFIKQRTPGYRDIYDREKERQLKLGGWDEKKKVMRNKDKDGSPQRLGHADNRARRKMIKRFLGDYYEHCRVIRGLPKDKCYAHRND